MTSRGVKLRQAGGACGRWTQWRLRDVLILFLHIQTEMFNFNCNCHHVLCNKTIYIIIILLTSRRRIQMVNLTLLKLSPSDSKHLYLRVSFKQIITRIRSCSHTQKLEQRIYLYLFQVVFSFYMIA